MKIHRQIARANERIAEAAAAVINSMWTFWLLLFVTLAPLAWPTLMPAEQYASSAVFQAVALPLLGVSGAVQSRQLMRLLRRIAEKVHQIEEALGRLDKLWKENHSEAEG